MEKAFAQYAAKSDGSLSEDSRCIMPDEFAYRDLMSDI
jgi:hypothetical protein